MSAAPEAWALLAATIGVAVLRATVPILFAALGGLLSDLAGSVNVALEGLMLIAAFTGVMAAVALARWFPGLPVWLVPWLGCAGALAAALAVAFLLAFFHLELGADLIVAGMAINILAAGLTVFLLYAWVGDKGSTAGLNSPSLPTLHLPGFEGLPVLDVLLNGENRRGHHVLLYAACFAVPALSFYLARMRHGLWLRAVGANPQAAAIAGIPVKRVRYAALLGSGLLAGLGGVYLSMGYLTLFQADMTAGRGFLALAAVFLGARHAPGTAAAALLFGASAVLATHLGAFEIPTQLVYMLPPAITLAALVWVGARKRRARSGPSH